MKRVAPWTVVAVVAMLTAFASVMPDEDWPFAAIVSAGLVLTFATACGALIASRRPDNAVGWILIGVGLCVSSLLLSTQYANRVLVDAPGSLPGGIVAAWLQSWVAIPALPLVAFLFLLFPTGTLPGPRWRWVARLIVVGATVAIVATMVRPGPFETFPSVANPLGVGPAPTRWIFEAGLQVMLLGTLLSVISVVTRYRRSSGAERVQLRWFSYAVVTAMVLFLTSPLYFLLVVRTDDYIVLEWLGFIFPLIGSVLIPSSIALAILRHRLYDIDRIISRTVGYAIVTAALAGLFAFVALTPTTFLGAAEAPEWLIAAGTLAVVALFRPVRRRVQDAVDRRFNRARYDATRTIAAFASHLREHVDIEALVADLSELVQTTMQPTTVSVWIRDDAHRS